MVYFIDTAEVLETRAPSGREGNLVETGTARMKMFVTNRDWSTLHQPGVYRVDVERWSNWTCVHCSCAARDSVESPRNIRS